MSIGVYEESAFNVPAILLLVFLARFNTPFLFLMLIIQFSVQHAITRV